MAEILRPAPAPAPAPTLKAKPIIAEKLRPLASNPKPSFEADKHLNYTPPARILSMKDLGLPDEAGISPVGCSDPFPLFSEEAINLMRGEIFTNEVWDNCMVSTAFAGCQLRGHCPRYAPFMHQAWTNPEIQAIINNIAGVDLVPVMDIEVGNINISVRDQAEDISKRAADQGDHELPVTKWHHDSYPFVCVVMMSDASKMVGGETAMRTGDGSIMKVRGPQMGCAVVLQGRCISHQALAAIGGTERITMITAYRPRDPFVSEDSDLNTIRPITNRSDLYYQWTKYRMEVLRERLRVMLEVLEEEHDKDEVDGTKTDAQRIKRFLTDQEEWLHRTNCEIVVGEDGIY